MIKNYLCYLLFLLNILFSEELIDGVVARVADNTILNSDILQIIQIQAMQMGIDINNNPTFIDESYNQALDFIINQYVVYELAKKDTLVSISGDEINYTIENEIELMTQRAGSKIALENILNMSIQEYKIEMWEEVKRRLLIEKYQQSYLSKITISRPEIIEFYNNNIDSIPNLPPSSSYSIIELPIEPSKEAENNTISLLMSIKDSIIVSNNFDKFAKQYSQDPGSKNNGGDLGYILRGNLVKEFEETAFSLNINEISNPIKTNFGYHLIQTIGKKGEKVHAKHILIQTKPTEIDKKNTESLLQKIYKESKNNNIYFDSLAYDYQKKYQNKSGVFNTIPDETIAPEVLNLLKLYKKTPQLLYPKESENNSYLLIFIKNRKGEDKITLKNSWKTLEIMAKNNKIAEEFEMWINSEKENIFIQRF